MGIDYPAVIEGNAAELAAVARSHGLSAEVPTCPGWDLAKLLGHLGRVFSWAADALEGAGEPPGRPPKPPDGEDVVPWFEGAAARVVDACRALPPDAPVWNFAGAPPTAAFWPRRQAHESTIHAWDGLHAVGGTKVIDTDLAVDGIAEYLLVVSPHLVGQRDGIDIGGSLHLHTTDATGEWTIHTDDGVLRVVAGHAKGDAAVRGPAADLLLLLWQRVRVGDDAALEVFGNVDVVDRWLGLGTL